MTEPVRDVLFLCTGNSARSILAEALMDQLGQGAFKGYSAGSFPKGEVNPLALELLREQGLPTAHLRSKSWDEFARPGAPTMDYVFTVCDQAAGEVCPIWPGHPVTAHWGIPDPAAAEGVEAERMLAFREAFRTLERRIRLFLDASAQGAGPGRDAARGRGDRPARGSPRNPHRERHDLPQPGLRHVAQRAGADPQQRRSSRDVIEYLKTPPSRDELREPDRGAWASRCATCCAAKARPTTSWDSTIRRWTDDQLIDAHDGAPDPDQPADRGDAEGREAVPALRGGARSPAAAAGRVRQGGRRARRRRDGDRAGRVRIADAAVADTRTPALGTFERYLTLWVALCIVAGIALGQLLPGACSTPSAAPRSRRSTCRWRP